MMDFFEKLFLEMLIRCLGLLFIFGCADESPPPQWDYIHSAVILPSCAAASCHSSLAVEAGVVLEDPDASYEFLLDEQFVIPGDTSSALVYLLRGDERPLMPPDGELPAGDVDLIIEWIESGAPR